MPKDKPNYQPWREVEFAADPDVTAMTSIQRWMYRTLLQKAWVCDQKPNLPTDDEKLRKYAMCDSKELWLQNKAEVLAMFREVNVNGEVQLARKRLELDWGNWESKCLVNSERASRAGLASAAKRAAYAGGNDGVLDEIRKMYTNETEREPEPKLLKYQKDKLKELIRQHGGPAIVDTFYVWIDQQVADKIEHVRPIGDFLKEAEGYLATSAPQESPTGQPDATAGHPTASLDQLLTDLTLAGDGQVHFGETRHKAVLIGLLRLGYDPEEILQQFKQFYANIDGTDKRELKWAADKFCKNAKALVSAHRHAIVERHEQEVRQAELAKEQAAWAAKEFPAPAPAPDEPTDDFFEIEVK